MSEEEKIFSVTHFWEDETRAYYEGKPFTGVCVDYYQNGKKNMRKCVNEKILKLNNLKVVDLDHNDLEFLKLKDLLDKDLIRPLYLS